MRTSLLSLILLVTAVSVQATSYQTRSDRHAVKIEVVPTEGGSRFNVDITDVVTGYTLWSPHVVGAAGTDTVWTDDNGALQIRLTLRANKGDVDATVEFRENGRLSERMQSSWSQIPRPVPLPDVPLSVGGDVKAPRLIHRVEPLYPEKARKARISGIVIVEALVTREGKVKDVVVRKSLPPLDEAALAAVRQWTFEPGTLNDRPVDVYFNLVVNFFLTPSKP
ncbi:MAG TPA: energy transducer TonB [Thermoanaerobaculia bacterium]|nr:energy transducer TonB [Thermoanaerobaculia bacterium]